jgi:hypothetical protein
MELTSNRVIFHPQRGLVSLHDAHCAFPGPRAGSCSDVVQDDAGVVGSRV